MTSENERNESILVSYEIYDFDIRRERTKVYLSYSHIVLIDKKIIRNQEIRRVCA